MEPTPSSNGTAEQGATRRLVAKNALYLTLSQAATVPVSVLLNAMMARYLGAEAFGYIYLAATFSGFGMLAVGWGHDGVLPAMVAQDRSTAGALLGTSFAWRAGAALFVYVVLAALCHFLGYNAELQWALGLTYVGTVLSMFVAACKDTIRGFERADIPALAHVGQQFLVAALVVPVLLLGGRMRSTLAVTAAAGAIVFIFIVRSLRSVGIGRVSLQRHAFKALFIGGAPFVVNGLAMALQPNIDAIYLSKFGSLEAVGWFAVARRLVGLLLFPAAALIGALYPTLCRLWVSDKQEFRRTSQGSLHSVALLVVPIALGCGLFPDVGIAIFNKETFGPAADDLRVLSFYLFLVYFSMPLGTCILAAGKQRAWSVVQSLCVVVSLVLDPLLIPWFELRYGNGGLGPCVASVASELLVVGGGILLMPAGIFDRALWRSLLHTCLAGLGMAGVALALRSITPFLAAPIAVFAYGAGLWITGEITRSHIAQVRGVITRKLSRNS